MNSIVLLESTSTAITLPERLFDMFKRELQESYGDLEGVTDGSVFERKGIQSINHYPTFDLQLSGALLHLPPQLYFMKKNDLYYLQIQASNYSVLI